MSELALGTVQFGLDYGITNSNGEISDLTMSQMLEIADTRGIQLFDTAADYGISQLRLGQFSQPQSKRRYVTKFSLPQDGREPTPGNTYVNSMTELNVDVLHGLLFHKLEDLSDSRFSQVLRILREGRESGKVSRIGVSVYNSEDLHVALDVFPDLDIIQLPANILALDLLNSTEISDLVANGVEIHVRSVFLQGLLLSDPVTLPDYFAPLKPALLEIHNHAQRQNISVLGLLLSQMRDHPNISSVLVGATTVSELEEIVTAWEITPLMQRLALPVIPQELLDPRKWPKIRMSS